MWNYTCNTIIRTITINRKVFIQSVIVLRKLRYQQPVALSLHIIFLHIIVYLPAVSTYAHSSSMGIVRMKCMPSYAGPVDVALIGVTCGRTTRRSQQSFPILNAAIMIKSASLLCCLRSKPKRFLKFFSEVFFYCSIIIVFFEKLCADRPL